MTTSTGYNPEEYFLGGGMIEIAKRVGGSTPSYPSAYADIGDIQDLSIEPKVSIIDHYTSNFGVKELDKQDVTLVQYNLKFKISQMNKDTLAMFVLGTVVNDTTIKPMTDLTQEYAIKFTPAYTSGELWSFHFWRVKITPASALALIHPADYGTMEFAGQGLADRVSHSSNPYWEMVLSTS